MNKYNTAVANKDLELLTGLVPGLVSVWVIMSNPWLIISLLFIILLIAWILGNNKKPLLSTNGYIASHRLLLSILFAFASFLYVFATGDYYVLIFATYIYYIAYNGITGSIQLTPLLYSGENYIANTMMTIILKIKYKITKGLSLNVNLKYLAFAILVGLCVGAAVNLIIYLAHVK